MCVVSCVCQLHNEEEEDDDDDVFIVDTVHGYRLVRAVSGTQCW